MINEEIRDLLFYLKDRYDVTNKLMRCLKKNKTYEQA